MSHLIRVEADLDRLDADGALRETAEAAGLDRKDFLKRGAIAGGGFIASGIFIGGMASPAAAAISTSRKSKANDVKILNYALTLEFLEAEFYKQALANDAFSSGQYRLFAQVTGEHEAAHVSTLRKVLGKAAVKKPRFDFGTAVTDPGTFAKTAQVLEDTGVAAYAGQGPNILQRPVVRAALAIHSVEARHAGWIRALNTGLNGTASDADPLPAPLAFDEPLGEKTVLKAVKATGFIES